MNRTICVHGQAFNYIIFFLLIFTNARTLETAVHCCSHRLQNVQAYAKRALYVCMSDYQSFSLFHLIYPYFLMQIPVMATIGFVGMPKQRSLIPESDDRHFRLGIPIAEDRTMSPQVSNSSLRISESFPDYFRKFMVFFGEFPGAIIRDFSLYKRCPSHRS